MFIVKWLAGLVGALVLTFVVLPMLLLGNTDFVSFGSNGWSGTDGHRLGPKSIDAFNEACKIRLPSQSQSVLDQKCGCIIKAVDASTHEETETYVMNALVSGDIVTSLFASAMTKEIRSQKAEQEAARIIGRCNLPAR